MAEKHGADYHRDYLTDLVGNRSSAWLEAELTAAAVGAAQVQQPLLAVVHTPAPHRPAEPAPQFINSFSGRMAPRTPSWNHIGKSKHRWLSELEPMNSTLVEYSDHIWRRRLRSLQSVDALVAKLYGVVEKHGALDKTVFFYTSDHGYHSGQWGVAAWTRVALPFCTVICCHPYGFTIQIRAE